MSLTLLLIVGGIALVSYIWYASIIGKRNKALEALSTIDVQMKMRLDLVPNILKIARKFMDHEKALLTEITALREKADASYDRKDQAAVQEHLAAAEKLTSKMGQFMVQVENYPDLKSDQTMIQAMQTYNEAEAQISAARRFYNSAVTSLNNAVQIFPGNLIAQAAHVEPMPFFAAPENVQEPINADNYLG